MTSKELALFAAKILDSKKARDVLLIDIAERSGFGDWFVNATAGGLRQLEALADSLEEKLEEAGAELRHIEGKGGSGWILVDLGDVIVNLFTEEQREHYQIERIWSDCRAERFKGAENIEDKE